MKTYEITAQDRLFFRDGRPFEAGVDHGAISRPYLPGSVLYGALRSQLVLGTAAVGQEAAWINGSQNETPEKILAGSSDMLGTLRIIGPWVKRSKEDLFPQPADLWVVEDQGIYHAYPFEKRVHWPGAKGTLDSLGLEPLFSSSDSKGKESRVYLTENQMHHYLLGEKIEPFKYESLYDFEEVEGIGLDRNCNSKTVIEGALFGVRFLRPRVGVSWRFQANLSGLEKGLSQQRLLRLGGEGRVVELSIIDTSLPFEGIKKELANRLGSRFKWVLLTPAFFGNEELNRPAWMPSWLRFDDEDKHWIGQIPDISVKVRLVSAAIPRVEWVSGWDMAKRCPKPSLPLTPAGSVFNFEILEGEMVQTLETLHFKCLSDHFVEAGYGLGIIGGIKDV